MGKKGRKGRMEGRVENVRRCIYPSFSTLTPTFPPSPALTLPPPPPSPSTQQFPCMGFGARIPPHYNTSHCFSLQSFTSDISYAHGCCVTHLYCFVASKLYGVNAAIIIFLFVLYCIVFFCFVLYCIVLYCFVFYCIVLCCILLYFIVLYCVVFYCILLYYIVLYCVLLYCILFYCIVLYLCRCIVVCHTSS